MRRGELWWVNVRGLGQRPALVMTRDLAVPLLNAVVVALATSNVRGVPTEVELDERDGMPQRSVVSFDNIRTVLKEDLVSHITTLSAARLEQACVALRYALGC